MAKRLFTMLIGWSSVAVYTSALAERTLQLGVVVSASSSFYKGAGNKLYALPLVIAEYGRFYLQGSKGGYRLYQDDVGRNLALEVRHTFDGYQSSDSDTLTGMDDRDNAWEAGLVYETSVFGGLAKALLMQDISKQHSGLTAEFSYERPFWANSTHMMTWYTGVDYWSQNKADYYFGVSPEESTANRPEYSADTSYRLHLGSNYIRRISDTISLIGNAGYLWMTDAVKDSPLTDRQSQWSVYAGVFYEF